MQEYFPVLYIPTKCQICRDGIYLAFYDAQVFLKLTDLYGKHLPPELHPTAPLRSRSGFLAID